MSGSRGHYGTPHVVFKQLDRLHSGDLTTMNLLSSSVPGLRKVSITVVASCLLLMVFWLFSFHSLAQSIQGSIIGTVVDKAGAVVPGATVTLTNLDEGSIRTAVTNGSGEYQFIDTKAGQYSVEVGRSSAETPLHADITLSAAYDTANDK